MFVPFPGLQAIPPGFPFPPPPGNLPSGTSVSKGIDSRYDRAPEECEPNETLYVNNLNDRIKERDLKAYLQQCILVVMSSLRRRGQAWIIYEDITGATRAMEALQGQLAFGKKMRISYSRNLSDVTRVRRSLEPRQKDNALGSNTAQLEKNSTETLGSSDAKDTFFRTSFAAPKTSSSGYNPPNRILFVENLSERTSTGFLTNLFKPFEGFVEARVIPSRGVAFVEFQDEYTSQIPLAKLQNQDIELGRFLIISNARK